MWVYIESGGEFLVGFYSPDGKWHTESVNDSIWAARLRVNFLNGGDGRPTEGT